VIHFGQGQAVSVGELAQRCLDAVGSKAQVISVPERQRPEKSEVGLLLCDASKARRLLGWAAKITLDEGLRRTADYLRQNLSRYRSDRYAV
jgi:nucleoside-diphosphate-sugar epimerase